MLITRAKMKLKLSYISFVFVQPYDCFFFFFFFFFAGNAAILKIFCFGVLLKVEISDLVFTFAQSYVLFC